MRSRYFRCCEAERSEAAVQQEKRPLMRRAAKLETSMTASRDFAAVEAITINDRMHTESRPSGCELAMVDSHLFQYVRRQSFWVQLRLDLS